MKDWIKELCPDVEDWQAELIAEHCRTKREWQGLTEKEQDAVFKTFSRSDAYKKDFLNRIASSIEAKLKEKNT